MSDVAHISYRLLAEKLTEVQIERDRLREALIPFAFIGRTSMEPLGLADEYDNARRLLGLDNPDV